MHNAEAHPPRALEEELQNYKDLPIGEIFRRARAYYGQSIEEVGAILRIRPAQLEAIEQGRLDLLPGRVYAIGFVRSYAEYLGLDGEKIVQLFKLQSGGQPSRQELHMPLPASETGNPGPYLVGGAMVALVAVLGALGVFVARDTPQNKPVIPEVPAVMQEQDVRLDSFVTGDFLKGEDATEEEKSLRAATEEVIVPAARVLMTLNDSAWVEIRDDKGKALISRILKKGDQYSVPDDGKTYLLYTGNIAAIDFAVDGKKLAPLGEVGDIRRGVKLDPKTLLEEDKANPRRTALEEKAGETKKKKP